MSVRDRLERRLEPGVGFDSVQLAGRDEGSQARPRTAAFVMTCEERVLARQGQRPDLVFNEVGVCALVKVHCSPRWKTRAGKLSLQPEALGAGSGGDE